MYQIDSTAVAGAIESDCRTFRALIKTEYDSISGSDVGRITTEQLLSEDEKLTIGAVTSRRAEVHLFRQNVIKKGTVFQLYLYLLGDGNQKTTHRNLKQWTHAELSMLTQEQTAALGSTKDRDGAALDDVYIPFGEYAAEKVKIKNSEIIVTAYDKLYRADEIYLPGIAFPADSGTVTEDVLRQLGIENRIIPESGNLLSAGSGEVLDAGGEEILVSAEDSFMIPAAPEGKTCRQVLGAIAAMYGKNGILDRMGNYTTVFIRTGAYTLQKEKFDEPEFAETCSYIAGLVCRLDAGTALTAGETDSPATVEFECPYMTQERLETLWQNIGRHRLEWLPAQMHERLADPRHDIGDSVRYGNTLPIPVTSLTFHFDGGLSADMASCGIREEI